MEYNIVGWFEIPAKDIERAITFYEDVFAYEMKLHDLGGVKMGWFPSNGNTYGTTGTLIQNDHYEPKDNGTLVYFSCENIDITLEKVSKAGGKILQPKKKISPDHGSMGVFLDSEGNRVALHSKE